MLAPRVRTPRSTRFTALVVALGAAASLAGGTAAASTPDDSTAATSPVATDAESSAPFTPVTIEHRYGTTEVAERPERIVSLDGQWTDTLVALGAPPVGFAVDAYADGIFPWLGDALDDSTAVDVTDGIPLEQVAALDPDLIVISWAAEDEAMYDDLRAIAPTITSVSDAVVDPWQDIAGAAGQVLGMTDEADTLIADIDAQVAAVAAELPTLAGKTFAFANYVPGDQIYVLTDPADGAIAFFMSLGLELPEALQGAEGPAAGRFEVSFEQISMLDADVLIMLTNGADTADITGFDQLRAVQQGSWIVLDYDAAVSLNVPSVLSLPYGIEAVRPALEAAA